MNSDASRPDRYRALADLLSRAGAAASPAEAHGVICGALCAGVRCRETQRWLPVLGLDGDSPDDLAQRARSALEALCEISESRLGGDAFAFEPLLPADATSVDTRAESMAQWCRGFLLGLLDLGQHDMNSLPGDATEIARDMMAITRLESGPDRDEGEDKSETAERAFEELREYLRVGVQLIFEELHDARQGDDPTGG